MRFSNMATLFSLLSVSLMISTITPCSAAPVKRAAVPVRAGALGRAGASHAASRAGCGGDTNSAAGRAYSLRLWNKVQAKWNFPDGNNNVTLTATMSGDGNVESVKLSSSPKSAEAEAAAQAAFEAAKPLDGLPGGARGTVTIVFNSKSDPHGDSSSGGSVRLDQQVDAPVAAPAAQSAPSTPSTSSTPSTPAAEPVTQSAPSTPSTTSTASTPAAEPAPAPAAAAPAAEAPASAAPAQPAAAEYK